MTLQNSFDPGLAAERCAGYRRRILEISQQVMALHMAGAYSCTELTDTVYNGLMHREADGSTPDTFLMSKGHGCMIQYVILEDLGILSRKDLDRYCTVDGQLGCHPDYGVPGIEASTGSLGGGAFALWEDKKSNQENLECSGRGLCDRGTGNCRCHIGFSSSNGLGNGGPRGDCGYYTAYQSTEGYPKASSAS